MVIPPPMPDDPSQPGLPLQLELPWDAPASESEPSPEPTGERVPPRREAPKLRLIQGGGERVEEALDSRDSVVRVLIEAGADLLLRRISSVRAEEIERRVNAILNLFDRVDANPKLLPKLRADLDELEVLMGETRDRARAPKRRRSGV